MDTIVVKGENSYFLGSRAYVLNEDREMANGSWASKHMTTNKAFKWILGRYVEADNANSNNQYWTAGDLQLKHPTVKYAPLNMLHQQKNIVGAYVASEMLYPTDEKADGTPQNPYVEALAAFWSYYFPGELAAVEAAHAEGSLFYSMECVGDTVTFRDGASEETFPYRGPQDESYGAWNENRAAIRQLDNPHFLGGALIIPPVKPGWTNAEIKDISKYVSEHQEMSEMVYNGVKEQANHLSPVQIEAITLELIAKGMDLGNDENSNTGGSVPNNVISETIVADDNTNNSEEGGTQMADKTFTEDELKAAIADAVAPLQAKLDAYDADATEAAHAAKVAAVAAEYDAKLEELQLALDTAVLEATASKTELAELHARLASESEAAEKAAEIAARRDERLAQVKELASFPDEYITANADRWAELSEEVFTALLEDYKAVTVKGKTGDEGPGTTSLTATAMVASSDSGKNTMTDRREVLSMRLNGIDPHTI